MTSTGGGRGKPAALPPHLAAERYCARCDRSFPDDVAVCPDDGTPLVRLAETADPLPGRVLNGRFEVRERLSAGGMGAVYRGWQYSVSREVAIKVIHPSLGADREAAKRFMREAKLASQLAHPNTVGILDFGQTEDGLFYLVMELLRGRTLGDLLDDAGPFPLERVIHVGLQLCDALSAAHELGIVHRDLKPMNIMVLDEPAGRDHLKVLDFGLAKVSGGSVATRSGIVLGTPGYMSPEALVGDGVDARGDLYSVGVILYELLTGRPPFRGATPEQQAFDPPPPLGEGSSPLAENVLFRLLQKKPDRRYQSAKDLREALLALKELRGHDSVTRPVEDLAASGSAQQATVNLRAARPRPSTRWRWLGLSAIVLLGAGAAGLVWRLGVATEQPARPAATARAKEAKTVPVPAAPGLGARPQDTAPVEQAEVILDLASSPPARVLVNGVAVGSTPLQHRVARGTQPLALQLVREGYRTERRKVVPDRSPQRIEVQLARAAPKPLVKPPVKFITPE